MQWVFDHLCDDSPCRIWSQSHQSAHRYPWSYGRTTRAWTGAMAGQSHCMRWFIYLFIFVIAYCMASIIKFDKVFPLVVFQGIYSYSAEPVHRRGNSQPDLVDVKAQRDSSGWHKRTRTKTEYEKGDNNKVCYIILFPVASIINSLSSNCYLFIYLFIAKDWIMLVSVFPPSSVHFIYFSIVLFFLPPLLFTFFSLFSLQFQNLSPVQSGSHQTQESNHPRFDSSQFPVHWFCSVSPECPKYRSSQSWFFLIAITAKFQFFDSLIFLAIRACCSTCCRQQGEAEAHVSAQRLSLMQYMCAHEVQCS